METPEQARASEARLEQPRPVGIDPKEFKPPLIEDHALIGNMRTAALVTRNGTIDWLCFPRFDSDACFAALLGTGEHGFWRLAPSVPVTATSRRYRGNTLILETEFATEGGAVRLIDFMPPSEKNNAVVRIVECVRGEVPMRSRVMARFGYGRVLPLYETRDAVTVIYAGPDVLRLESDLTDEPPGSYTEFTVSEGDRVSFMLSHMNAYEEKPPPTMSAARAERETTRFWREWTSALSLPQNVPQRTRELLMRSFITLKACTYAPTGAIVAAPTTSLPEGLGGERNWDYRYCWLRDASFTVVALLGAGQKEEAVKLAQWGRRAEAGDPSQFQIMYGIGGERRLNELELEWLPGYENSKPVRTGNEAYKQYQLDVPDEVCLNLYAIAKVSGKVDPRVAEGLVLVGDYICDHWQRLDRGIWEMRGPDRAFTASKVSAWSALDRCIRAATEFEFDAPVSRWKGVRQAIHDEICAKGFDPERNTFTQFYGSKELDASLLSIPLTGFLPPDDPRCVGTVEAVARELMQDGFLMRYRPIDGIDGLRGTEGAFLACSFMLVQAYQSIGRHGEAEALFNRLTDLCNDVGLLAEEYDPKLKRHVGNFPQALSHLALIEAGFALAGSGRFRST